LGLFDDLSYAYSLKGGVMKISKISLVMMKGQKVNQLYKRDGNIVLGGVAITTPINYSIDDTQLWHMQLGHIGDHGGLELHKRKLLKGVKTR
jgi:hypothetical protein